MVRTERLELSHLAALEPKSSVSTNFTTSAYAKHCHAIYRVTNQLELTCSARDGDSATESTYGQPNKKGVTKENRIDKIF